MNKFVIDLNDSILSKGVSGLKSCITQYLFGISKIVDLSNKSDSEKIEFINKLSDDLVISYQKSGISGMESYLKQHNIIG